MQRSNPLPSQTAQLTKIESAAIHLLTIINDILELSKIEAGKLTAAKTLKESLRTDENKKDSSMIACLIKAVMTQQAILHKALKDITEQNGHKQIVHGKQIDVQNVLTQLAALLEKDDTMASKLFSSPEALLQKNSAIRSSNYDNK